MEEKKRILLIEDDNFLIDIYTMKLGEAGFEVETANHGEEALEKLKTGKFDLILLDIVLPHLTGFELLERAKKDIGLENLKVIIFSNLGQKRDIERGSELGVAGYLVKAHYTPDEIVEEVKKVLFKEN